MATRRPKVPSAQFHAGAKKVPVEPGTTPEPTPGAHRTAPGTQGTAPGARGTSPGARGATPGGRRTVTYSRADSGADGSGSHGRRSHGESLNEDDGDKPVPARSFNGRLLVLGLAMAAVTVALAPNVHTFMEQRAEISALKQDIAAQSSQQAAFQSELARWEDPAYVKQQARDRVSMLMPGETGYWVYGPNPASPSNAAAGAQDAAKAAGESAKKATMVTAVPWVDSLWQAVEKSAAVKPATKAATPAAPAVPNPTAK